MQEVLDCASTGSSADSDHGYAADPYGPEIAEPRTSPPDALPVALSGASRDDDSATEASAEVVALDGLSRTRPRSQYAMMVAITQNMMMTEVDLSGYDVGGLERAAQTLASALATSSTATSLKYVRLAMGAATSCTRRLHKERTLTYSASTRIHLQSEQHKFGRG